MTLGKGAKIAIGCGIAAVLMGVVVMVGVFGAVWWGKGKVEQFTSGEKKIADLKKRANAVAFTLPADGVIQEARLLKFLDVRKRVFTVYEKHKDEIEAMGKKKQGDFSDIGKAFSWMSDLRTAQAEGLAEAGMSEAEYLYLVTNIYKTMWAAEVAKSSGGKSVSEATGEAMDKAAEQMAKAQEDMAKSGARGASEEADAAQDAAAKSLDESARQMQEQAKQARENAKQLDVPPANIALFHKYEADIKKYAMSGLEWIGF